MKPIMVSPMQDIPPPPCRVVICAKLCPPWKGQSGATHGDFSQTCSQRFADLLMKPRLSRAPIPEETKGEPIPRSLKLADCLSRPAAQLAHISGCQASAMLSQRMSSCRLPSGKSDNQRMKPSMDHQLSSQGLSANSLKMMWGVTLLRVDRDCRRRKAGCLACLSVVGPRPEGRPEPRPHTHTKLWGAQPRRLIMGKDLSHIRALCLADKQAAAPLPV